MKAPDRTDTQVGVRVQKAMKAMLVLASEEADAGLPPVVQTRLKRGVVGALAFLQDAVARAHVEIRKPKPNAVAVAIGGKAAVALLQGTGLLQTFHVFDDRALDAEGLSDVLVRAEALRLALAGRAAHLAAPEAQGEAIGAVGEAKAEAQEEQASEASEASYNEAGARDGWGMTAREATQVQS